MKKIALTILTATFIIILFSIDTEKDYVKDATGAGPDSAFRNTIGGAMMGQSANTTINTEFNFKKEEPVTQKDSSVANIQGRDELLKLSQEIREKSAKIKNLRFNPTFIKDDKFKNLVELQMILEEPISIGVKNPFLDLKYRNVINDKKSTDVKNPTLKDSKIVGVNPGTLPLEKSVGINNTETSSPLLAFAQCIVKSKTVLYVADESPKSDDQLALFEDYSEDINYVNCTNDDEATSAKKPFIKECTDKKITTFPTWVFPKSKIVVGVKDIEYLKKATGCVYK